MKKSNPLLIIGYIKSSIEILINLKVQEVLKERESKRAVSSIPIYDSYDNGDGINDYEKLLRKLESDIRGYVRVSSYLK